MNVGQVGFTIKQRDPVGVRLPSPTKMRFINSLSRHLGSPTRVLEGPGCSSCGNRRRFAVIQLAAAAVAVRETKHKLIFSYG